MYEYTDYDGDRLAVAPANYTPNVVIQMFEKNQDVAIAVKREDAPAIALAVLEAAGIKDANDEPYPSHETERLAVRYLRETVKRLTRQAEREAEDAKVLEYLLTTGQADNEGYRVLDLDRENYRAARKFFTEES